MTMKKYIPLIMLVVFCSTSLSAQESIAITTKTTGSISFKRANQEEFSSGLKIGTRINNNDQIKTGEDGYAVVVFLDDKSQLKVQPNSVVQIEGASAEDQEGISKRINVDTGKLKAEVAEQRRGDFVIATPTSVASVKGTIFWIIVDPVFGDQVVVESGNVELTNNVTGQSVTVESNQSGSSNQEGNVEITITLTITGTIQSYTEGVSMTVNNVSLVSGESPEGVSIEGAGPLNVSIGDFTTFEGGQPSAGDNVTINGQLRQDGTFTANIVSVVEETHRMEIEFENSDGERRKLEIEYK
ncbi:MAG: FecR family protein [Candidatus Marinimicrobia bacterium]|nr:FecR family protein [Candidatus Neomarinimicrobiota bacterium]MCF7829805.1 FecR family protein [Candidatus Neomarinimicrobiota bacterium]MCF7881762.1 FecR family protein [Candidatus Neomarinimicrobiota bacterium]